MNTREGWLCLLVARSDGRVGPNLKLSTSIDATTADHHHRSHLVAARQESRSSFRDVGGQGYITSGGMDMPRLAQLASGWSSAGNGSHRLERFYALELHYASTRVPAADTIDPATPPIHSLRYGHSWAEVWSGKRITMPVLVIDHIERPTRMSVRESPHIGQRPTAFSSNLPTSVIPASTKHATVVPVLKPAKAGAAPMTTRRRLSTTRF